jgi:[NiFe] hydrogenase diaphorase moiety large subunit
MKAIKSKIETLLSDTDYSPDLLLQYLCTAQSLYSYVPERIVRLFADKLEIPPAKILGLVDFYAFLHREARGDFDILFSDSITDRMLGNRALIDKLCMKLGVELGKPRNDERVTIDVTSCTGICDQGPALLVNGMVVSKLDDARIDLIGDLVESCTPVCDWPEALFVVEDNIQRPGLLLSDHIANGAAIEALINDGSSTFLEVLEQSGLRGRGGAGFSTATKWRLCRNAPADERYVVCNADEGEPGTFKDRVLLNSYADNVFEGMTLCGGAVGAEKGYLYLRGEYRYLLEDLEETLQRRRNANLLGNNILGEEGFNFDIDIHLGAGAYICGEESALLESLSGKRGIPRDRPPFPVTSGFRQRPTIVNNVETFLAAAKIAVFGAQWFSSAGTEKSSGTKLLSISGDCSRPGIYEYPFGVSIRQILDDCGALDTQAVQVAGAAGTTIPPAEFDRSISFEDLSTAGSIMVFNQQRDLLDMVQNFSQFFCHESCGFCTPCRVGGTLMRNLVEKVVAGHATSYDLDEMKNIGLVMQNTAHCGLGATAANPVINTLHKFPDIYTKRLAHSGYEPAFNLDASLEISRQITGRNDEGAHIRDE